MDRIVVLLLMMTVLPSGFGADPIDVWPGLAPGETTHNVGEILPFRPTEQPPVTRVVKITRPTFTVHLAEDPNGSAAVILPGGGFGKVVPDKEGTEAADWLNRYGVSAFVLSYRTKEGSTGPAWVEPLQDAQRTLSRVRNDAGRWGLKEDQIGLVAFSAGGQVAARLLSKPVKRSYQRIDPIDDVPFRPDFAILVYPWNIYDAVNDELVPGINVTEQCPPVFLVHTDDDRSSSVGPALYYAGLRRLQIPAELHIYGNGGHGYGLRHVNGSQISSWPDHAIHWLATQKILNH
ncbi:MAG: alpha/beta hydrolase [Fuerstiella sp.]|nr:alpha/beta hydrolase [Fuerstiella sp.]